MSRCVERLLRRLVVRSASAHWQSFLPRSCLSNPPLIAASRTLEWRRLRDSETGRLGAGPPLDEESGASPLLADS
jgi:hypothetical protein